MTSGIDCRFQNQVVLGSGADGQVIGAYDTTIQRPVALKKAEGNVALNNLRLEASIYQKLQDHSYILQMQEVIEQDGSNFTLVLEKMGSTMYDRAKFNLKAHDAKRYLFQLLLAVAYMHSLGVLHRDLKTDNILLDPVPNVAKLADFGRACELPEDDFPDLIHNVLAMCLKPPELLMVMMELPDVWGSSQGAYGKPLDMWALGCVLVRMLSRGHSLWNSAPTAAEQLALVRAQIAKDDEPTKSDPDKWAKIKATIFPGQDPELLDLLEKMLDVDPDTRITPEAALNLGLFKTDKAAMRIEDFKMFALHFPEEARVASVGVSGPVGPLVQARPAGARAGLNGASSAELSKVRGELAAAIAGWEAEKAARVEAEQKAKQAEQRATQAVEVLAKEKRDRESECAELQGRVGYLEGELHARAAKTAPGSFGNHAASVEHNHAAGGGHSGAQDLQKAPSPAITISCLKSRAVLVAKVHQPKATSRKAEGSSVLKRRRGEIAAQEGGEGDNKGLGTKSTRRSTKRAQTNENKNPVGSKPKRAR